MAYDHRNAPENSDGRQEKARTNFADENSGGRLEENVRDEEDQDNHVISRTNEVEICCHSRTPSAKFLNTEMSKTGPSNLCNANISPIHETAHV